MTRSRRLTVLIAVALLGGTVLGHAQVRSIRSLSSGSRSGGGFEGAFGYGRAAYLVLEMMTNGVIDWQTATLRKKSQVPSVISLEVMMQVASQPSRYYVLNPRIRANWGIFVTDYRTNYMFEQVPGGIVDLRTDDWQILGLNLVQRPTFNLRFSTGIMYERFGNNNSYNESVVGAQWRSLTGRIGAMAEYRWAGNYSTGERPRAEINASFLRTIARTSRFDLALTIGGVFQNYYYEVPVWGLQGGLAARVF
jgi:hypothetical protein